MADVKLSFTDWLRTQPDTFKKLPYQQQQEGYNAYASAFEKTVPAPAPAVIDKAKAAVSPSSILKSILPNLQSGASTATSPNLNIVDQARQGLSDVDMSKKSPELINQLATFGGSNKDRFLQDWQTAKAAVAAFTPEAQRNDPNGYAAAQQKYEMYNTAANKLRYDYPFAKNNFLDQAKSTLTNALNPEIGMGVQQVPVPTDTGATPPPRVAPQQSTIAAAGPLPKEIKPQKKEVEDLGFDWEKVKETAKGLGTSILGVLNAAIMGRTSAMQGRPLDWSGETLLGRNEARAAEEAQQNKQFGWQEQLAAIDRDFQAEQAALNREFQAAMEAAKTEDEKQKVMAEFAQRDKEQRVSGQQRMAEIAANRQPTRAAAGGPGISADPLGIMGMK
jgi:hypothetical protein